MRIYVASSYHRKDDVRNLILQLKRARHTITFDWTTDVDQVLTIGAEAAALKDYWGVVTAEMIIVLHDDRGRGMGTELGVAVANFKKIIVVGSKIQEKFGCLQRENVFYHLPGVLHIDTVDELFQGFTGLL